MDGCAASVGVGRPDQYGTPAPGAAKGVFGASLSDFLFRLMIFGIAALCSCQQNGLELRPSSSEPHEKNNPLRCRSLVRARYAAHGVIRTQPGGSNDVYRRSGPDGP